MAGQNIGDIYATLRLYTTPFDRAIGNVQRDIGRLASGIGRQLKRIGIAATAYATVSLKAFADFDDAMVRSAAVTAGAQGEIEQAMRKTALVIAKESVLSAKELAEGYFALGQAGYNAAQSIKALPVVQEFAIASQIRLDTATRYLNRTLEGLNMASANPIKNMKQMQRVSDAFTYAAITTTAEIKDFAVAMTHAAAPALRLVNKDMEEGTAVLMAFARAGIVAEEAGTLLWTTVRDLQRANIKARDIWEAMGIEIYDTTGKMRNLADIFKDLEVRFSTMSDEGKKVSLMMLGFQDRSLRGIQALMGFSDEMKEFEENMRKTGGTTKNIAQKYMESFKASMLMLWHQVTDVSIAFGGALAPAIRSLAKDFARNEEVIKEWVTKLGKRIGSAIKTVSTFVRYIATDWEKGLKYGLAASLELFEGFSAALMEIFKQTFMTLSHNIGVWLGQSLSRKLLYNKLVAERYSVWDALIGTKEEMEAKKKQVLAEVDKLMKEAEEAGVLDIGIKEAKLPDFSKVLPILEDSTKKARKILDSIPEYQNFVIMSKMKDTLKDTWSSTKESVKSFVDYTKYGIDWLLKWLNVTDDVGKKTQDMMDMDEILFGTTTSTKELTLQLKKQLEAIEYSNQGWEESAELVEFYHAATREAFGDEWQRRIIINKKMEEYKELLEEIREKQQLFPIKQWLIDNDVSRVVENMAEVTAMALDDLSGDLADFMMTGEMDWKSFCRNLLREYTKTIIAMSMATTATDWKDWVKTIGDFFDNSGGGFTQSTPGGNTSYSQKPYPVHALGAVYSLGNLIPMALGNIVNRATLVPMAKGQTALIGEAGPEAIMPLTRTSEGELGVKAAGGGTTYNFHYEGVPLEMTRQEEYMMSDKRVVDVWLNTVGRKPNMRRTVQHVARR